MKKISLLILLLLFAATTCWGLGGEGIQGGSGVASSLESMVAPGTSGNMMKSDGTNWTSSNNITITTLDLTLSTSSIPWVVGTTQPTTFNVNGMGWYHSDEYKLIIRDQTNTRNLTFVPEGIPAQVTFDEHVEPATASISTAKASRGFINNYGQTGAALLTLPAAAEGLTLVAIVGTKVAQDWEFHHAGSETIYTDIGGVLTAGRAGIKCNNQEVGSRMSCATFQTGAGTYSWLCGAVSGTWTAVAP